MKPPKDPPDQPDLFGAEPPAPYRGEPPFVAGSDTSQAAAESIALGAASIRRMCLGVIAAGPCTCDYVEEVLRMRHQTVSARIRELVLMGLVYDTGARRETRSGSLARLYDTTRAGHQLAMGK